MDTTQIKHLFSIFTACLAIAAFAACSSEPIQPLNERAGFEETKSTGDEDFGTLASPLTVTLDGDTVGADVDIDIYDEDGHFVTSLHSDDDDANLAVGLPIGHYTAEITINHCTHSDSGVVLIDCAYVGDNPLEFTILAGVQTPIVLAVELYLLDGGTDGPVVFRDGEGEFVIDATNVYVPGGCDQCNDDEACVRLADEGDLAPVSPLPALQCLERCGGSHGGCGESSETCVQVAEEGDGPDDAFGVCVDDTP